MKSNNVKKFYEYSGARVRRDKAIYVPRKLDTEIYQELINDNCFISVTGPRQTGKTSLILGIADELSKKGFKVVDINFLYFPGQPVKELMQGNENIWWFRSLFEGIGTRLGIHKAEINSWFEIQMNEMIPFPRQFVCFFKEVIKPKVEGRILLVFDELDFFGQLGYYTNDFLDGLVILQDERDNLGLSVLIASVAPPALLLKARAVSSFKIGIHKTIRDFDDSDETVKLWVTGLNIKDEGEKFKIGKKILKQTGGQPFLTGWLMNKINESLEENRTDINYLIKQIIEYAHDPQGSLKHFNAPRDFIAEREGYAIRVLDQYKNILQKPIEIEQIDANVLAILYTTGLVKESKKYLYARCPIYKEIFNEKWCINTEQGFGARDWYSPLYIPSYEKKNKTHICLFNTGGTIGMVEHGNRMVPPQNEKEFLSIYPSLRNIAEIVFVQLNAKDGANIYPEDWSQIAKAIYDRRNDGYDGFVIACGTDTMAYTASAVAFALGQGLECPVVFVGSQAPHYVSHGDALVNLSRACMVASQKISEVVIVFGDSVLRAVRSEKLSDYHFQGFHSPTHKPLAIITEQIEIQQEALLKKNNPGRMECIAEFETQILQISQYPGFQPKWFDELLASKNIKGIIIESLGLGNLPTLPDSKYNMLNFIEKAVHKFEIPVIITSKYPIIPEFANKYLPATAPLQKGAISAGNMTSSSALTKLMWLLPQIEKAIKNNDLKKHLKLEEIKKLMSYSFVGEVDKMPITK